MAQKLKNIRRNAYAVLNLHVSNENYLSDNFEKISISETSSVITTTTIITTTVITDIDASSTTTTLNLNNISSKETNDEMIMIDNIQKMKSFVPLPELCLLPQDTGPCFGEILRWWYNSETNHCETFIYTGCGHNANYFTSEEACLRACGEYRNSDVCTMKMDRGHCELGIAKWYYDLNAGQCHMFIYTGCGGNGNRFSSKAECEHLCTTEIQFYSNNDEKDICQLDRESGPCDDPVTQWYFDSHMSQCMPFTYGGCRGNGNRFNSQKLCEQRCLQKSETRVIRNERTEGKFSNK
ncbi:unnamed protein product [Wuchereria bancrofti]|uniref:BPTI/Kunitz inhibitor domain-containing protein n=1 Tax=Wuchereria bancrofti TaxID=6293 RepID=A0A3P7FSG7_WUCBA|nr:unnamed protein product [Wuchereria bancrofti]